MYKRFNYLKIFFVLGIFTLLTNSCKKVSKDTNLLEGYWEIETVTLPDGNSKKYSFNQNVDYFKLENDTSGYRKKVQPLLDGSFLTSNDAERFNLTRDNEKIYIHYKNNLSEWTETIIKLNKDRMLIINENNLKYFYKKFEPIDIDDL